MTPAQWFWILFVVGVLFVGFKSRSSWAAWFVLVLLGLIGWAVFGGPIK